MLLSNTTIKTPNLWRSQGPPYIYITNVHPIDLLSFNRRKLVAQLLVILQLVSISLVRILKETALFFFSLYCFFWFFFFQPHDTFLYSQDQNSNITPKTQPSSKQTPSSVSDSANTKHTASHRSPAAAYSKFLG